ncbi:MAG TPA: hypothetical protein VIQ00_02885 [Chitinophagaceae bacterium]
MKLNHEMCEEQFKCLDIETKRWIICIANELERATEKHPNFPKDKIHAAAIVGEESGELLRSAIQFEKEGGRYYDMHDEAIQTGAMAIRFLLNAPELKLKS